MRSYELDRYYSYDALMKIYFQRIVTEKAYFLIDIFMDPTSIDFRHDFLKAIVLI